MTHVKCVHGSHQLGETVAEICSVSTIHRRPPRDCAAPSKRKEFGGLRLLRLSSVPNAWYILISPSHLPWKADVAVDFANFRILSVGFLLRLFGMIIREFHRETGAHLTFVPATVLGVRVHDTKFAGCTEITNYQSMQVQLGVAWRPISK